MHLNQEEVKELIHHRDPYLMVTRVESCNEKEIVAIKEFTGREPFVAGHFPGAPVVPGAMLQEFCTQSAGVLLTKFYSPVHNYNSNTTKGYALGVLRKVEFAKYIDMAKPTSDLQCRVQLENQIDNLFQFKAEVMQSGKIMAKLSFSLVNVSDEKLLS